MEKLTIKQRIKQWIAGVGFKLFIWGNDTSEEEYWDEIYRQEKYWRRANHKPL